jgi:cytochrome P450
MVAGSDTTASAIRATILHVTTNPRVYHKLKQVVREAVENGRVSSPIRQEEAKQVSYLQVCNPIMPHPATPLLQDQNLRLTSARP